MGEFGRIMHIIIVLGVLAIAGISLGLIYSSIENQQELSEINYKVTQTQMQEMYESASVTGVIDSDYMTIKNSMNEDTNLIQIRVYDDDGNFVKSFSVNNTISSNSVLKLDDLSTELQNMILE